MGEVVSQSYLFIDSPSQGNKKLVRVKTFTPKDDRDVEIVTAIGVDTGAGFRDKPGGGEVQLEVYREMGKPEVDYEYVQDVKEIFALTRQDVGGRRFQYQGCRVAKIEDASDNEGSHMKSVTVKYTRRVPLT